MKIVLSALACEPGKGSEPEVGFRAMLAAATRHDVWVLTVPESIGPIQHAIEGDERSSRIHCVAIEFESLGKRLDRLTAAEFHLGYERWQRDAASRATRLHRELGFDVAHHVTLASYWTRAGVSVLPIPLVLGPIGGGVDPPLRLLSELGIRGLIEATARIVGRPAVAMRPSVRRTHKLAAVILAQNIDTARRLRAHGRTTLLSNAFAVDLDDVFDRDARTKELLFVGRLLPWKAPILALRSFRYVQDPAAVLRFFGNGREQPRLERAAERWRLADRISFEGWVPRRELLSSVVRAGVLIHPAVHEEAGLCIAEALMLGTPVVALDHGGPSEIVGQWRGTPSALVLARGPDATAHSIAASVDQFLAAPPPVPTKPVRASTSFAGSILHAYDLAVRLGAQSGAGRRD